MARVRLRDFAEMLVLSLFPGIGLLDMAFEEEGFCVVRGPDLLWGGDIRTFHPPAGVFAGVIGGPPCQAFSQANVMGRLGFQPLAANLIPEFERCVSESQPGWFLMENVRQAPLPVVDGYILRDQLINNRSLGEAQNRVRRFSFGTRDGRPLRIELVALESAEYTTCVTANGMQDSRRARSRSDRSAKMLVEYIRLQGLPPGFLDGSPLTVKGRVAAVGNGVPLAMGLAVAKAVRRAMDQAAAPVPVTGRAPGAQAPGLDG